MPVSIAPQSATSSRSTAVSGAGAGLQSLLPRSLRLSRCPSERPLTHSLQVVLLLTLVVAVGQDCRRAGHARPSAFRFGEILIGVLLGPTLLNVLGWPIFASPAGAPGVPLSRWSATSRRSACSC